AVHSLLAEDAMALPLWLSVRTLRDDELAALAVGDRGQFLAIAELYQRHFLTAHELIRRQAARRALRPEEGEDALQDAAVDFLRAIEEYVRLDPTKAAAISFSGYLCRYVQRRFQDSQRRQRRRRARLDRRWDVAQILEGHAPVGVGQERWRSPADAWGA